MKFVKQKWAGLMVFGATTLGALAQTGPMDDAEALIGRADDVFLLVAGW